MNLEDIFKNQQMIINKIPKLYGISPLWLENFSKYERIIAKIPVIHELNALDLQKKYFKSFEVLDKANKMGEIFASMDRTAKMMKELNSVSSKFAYLNYDFSDLFKKIETQEDKEENSQEKGSESIIISETSRIKGIISEIYYNNLKLFSLHPREFEKIVAELLYSKGFEVELTKQTRDNGYDILALKHIDGFSPIKYLVECKRYAEKRKIGVEIIRSFKEVIQTENANKGLIVTTSYFSTEAIKKQRETPLLLDYKNKDEVIEWVNDYFQNKTSR